MPSDSLIPIESLTDKILIINKQKAMLDRICLIIFICIGF